MTNGYLQQQWIALGPTFDTPIGKRVYASLEKRYSAGNRYYHNLQHLELMFRLYDQYRSQLLAPEIVAHSIFWHDAVYRVRQKDNEEQSAKLAATILPGFGVSASDIGLIETFIRATQSHRLPAGTHPDLAWLLDFDLAILGSEWLDYEQYTKQIRREYRVYPDLLYRPGRLKVLKHFLELEHFYHTEPFRLEYESRARMNLTRESETLK